MAYGPVPAGSMKPQLAAMAASWGFMLPAGTGPYAIAWSTGRVHLPRMVKGGLALDFLGTFLIVGCCWGVAALM